MTDPVETPNRETTPRGKIGRLPVTLRDAVNGMIRDNKEAADIIAFLDSHGVSGVTAQNVSNWKSNGYTKWLANQERIDGIRATWDFAAQLARAESDEGIDGLTVASDAASRVAITRIMSALEGFDDDRLLTTLRERPEKLFDLIHALSSLRKGDQDATKLKMIVGKWREAADSLKARMEGNGGTATQADFDDVFKEAYGLK